jgi:hypothetical protein
MRTLGFRATISTRPGSLRLAKARRAALASSGSVTWGSSLRAQPRARAAFTAW